MDEENNNVSNEPQSEIVTPPAAEDNQPVAEEEIPAVEAAPVAEESSE